MRTAIAIAVASVIMGLTPALTVSARAQDVGFSAKPKAEKTGNKVKISFALSGPSDVEVAIVDGGGKVVRHLAAGVLGGKTPPPAPLAAGLAQSIEWNMADDFGKLVEGAALAVRVRAGTGVKFGQFIGADPYNFGRVTSVAADEDGNLYVLGFGGQLNQANLVLRVFDKEGRYLRELLPFPANLAKDAVQGVAVWDDQAQAFRPVNRKNLNPDFYGLGKDAKLVSASKTNGIVLSNKGRTLVLDARGAIRDGEAGDAGPARPADRSAFDATKAKLAPAGEKWAGPGEKAQDWTRLAVDYQRDEVYVNDGSSLMWRYDGKTGEGGLLKKGGKPFYAGDLTVGYDGLLYVRKCMGYPQGSDFSGPFHRFTRDLEPANYPSGTHVLSNYIYGRYGIGYADRGIGVGPDGTVYISFMYDWVKYCTAGFGPDGKALKGKYLEGLVGKKKGKDGYPEELSSAIIGPITGSHGGVRVDLKGDIYLGLWVWPKGVAVPAPYAKDAGYLCSTGSVIKFTPAGGMMTSPVKDWSSDPLGSTPRTEGATGIEARSGYRTPTLCYDVFVEGAVAAYPGYGPFSHANWGENNCCVCRAGRFDVDRYGRIIMPNAVTNSVKVLDNNGNLVTEFGKYGNFDSQYVPAGATGNKPLVATPDIPLGWPTCAGASEKSVYVLDSYARRVVRTDLTWKAEAVCDVK